MTSESCQAMGEMMGGMMSQMMAGGMSGSGMMWGGVPWFGLIALGVILVVGLAVALAITRRPTGDDSREILRRRFARGELSAAEFADALKALG